MLELLLRQHLMFSQRSHQQQTINWFCMRMLLQLHILVPVQWKLRKGFNAQEAVVGALRGELAATAVNAPMVPAEVLSELKPYVVLAEKLGRLAVQLVAGGSGVKTVEVTYASARAPDDLDTRLLRAMITKGIIEPISSVFVNLVNADFTAKQRGLRISEERIVLDGSPESPLDFIQVQIANVESKFASVILESGEIKVEGQVKDGIPHLTRVGSFEVDVSLEGSIILCRQVDQPAMIGSVGSICVRRM
ncbi:hypothetical protein CMV_014161 [Castanea mollissima]|uniref:phosphoglycerate dehydrogenase n=1 Tax=Castanea mollissima TaxID=60419 RepID=A0A8J4VHE2_9ROSI|nr:hypothetical protein CMV_014161 [Castanea mollissima]